MTRTNPSLPGRALSRPAPSSGAPASLSMGEAWGIVRRHMTLITITFMLCLILGGAGYVVCAKWFPRFKVQAYVQVDSPMTQNILEEQRVAPNPQLIAQLAETEALLVKSPEVIRRAVERSEVRATR